MTQPIKFLEPRAKVVADRDRIIADLKDILPADCLVHEPRELVPFETDAFVSYRRLPLAVALPKTTEDVAAVMKYCHRYGIPVVPRGAGTSLSGGAIPQEDAVVIGLSKMSAILELDFYNRTARVQAGVTNLSISDAAGAEGFFYAPDPSSQLACTIGGNIGMNSGGAHCLKYGVTTNNLLGVKMVLVDGTVLELGGKYLDASGYDLLALVCGSEGQLGIVTEATVRLIAKPEGARPVLFGFETSEEAGSCVADIIGAGIIPVAIEFMDKPAIEICEAFAKAGYPLDVGALLIVEVEGSEAEMDAMLADIVTIARKHGVKTVKECQSAMEAAAIWKGRKSAFGATGRIADYICMDGTVPLSQLSYVLKKTSEITDRLGLRVANVFHAGDGNMHPLILFNANDPEDAARAEEAGNEILKLCVDAGGCLTGEHGVGIEKRDLMRHQYGEADLAQQMAVRAAFDEGWLMNPSKVFPLEGGDDGFEFYGLCGYGSPSSALPGISPSRGEIGKTPAHRFIRSVREWSERSPRFDLPLEGEIPGRAEGVSLAQTSLSHARSPQPDADAVRRNPGRRYHPRPRDPKNPVENLRRQYPLRFRQCRGGGNRAELPRNGWHRFLRPRRNGHDRQGRHATCHHRSRPCTKPADDGLRADGPPPDHGHRR